MAQLTMNVDLIDDPLLREQSRETIRKHIEESFDEIEMLLPEDSPLILHIKKISKDLFGAHFRTRLFGRQVVVKAYDENLLSAVNRARRHLLRQVDDVRLHRRNEIRRRRTR
jgi:ribosome-associated translation inhibitor RaiA